WRRENILLDGVSADGPISLHSREGDRENIVHSIDRRSVADQNIFLRAVSLTAAASAASNTLLCVLSSSASAFSPTIYHFSKLFDSLTRYAVGYFFLKYILL